MVDKDKREDFTDVNIVVVEDNSVNLDLIQKVLALRKNTPKLFSNSLEAYDYIRQNYEQIDIVFMDISLPDIDGIMLTSLINQELGEKMPKVIALTANMSDDYKAKAFEVGMIDFVSKPYQFSDVFSVITKHR